MDIDWQSVDLANPTEEHSMLRKMIRDFVLEEVEPQALEYDKNEKFNQDLFRKLGDYGLLGISVSEEYGGSGMDATAVAIVNEELSFSGTLQKSETITGATSGATATILAEDFANSRYTISANNGFITGETVTGATSVLQLLLVSIVQILLRTFNNF